jgi:hypothetical protein
MDPQYPPNQEVLFNQGVIQGQSLDYFENNALQQVGQVCNRSI